MHIHDQLVRYLAENPINQDEREATKACNDMVGADFKCESSEKVLLQRVVTALGG